jgi:phage terminase large subunit
VKQFEIYITSRSSNLIKEIKKYVREIDKTTKRPTNEPVDVDNHALDAMRYAIMMKFDTRIKQKTEAVVQKSSRSNI